MGKSNDAAFWKSAAQLLGGLLLMAVFFFLSAGRLDIPRAWLLFGLYLAAVTIVLAAVRMLNPGLVPARSEIVKGELPWWDKVFAALYASSLYGTFIVCGLGVRFGLPGLGAWALPAGIAMLVFGTLLLAWAMAENRFFEIGARIQKESGHYAVTTGPYALVRHPGYLGMVLVYGSAPFVLGSLYGLVPALLLAGAFIFRTHFEDEMLRKELKGYKEYAKKVRYRLLPGVW